jgi:hypothetical protein
LLISKYAAGREKDLRYCSAVVDAGLVQKDVLLQQLRATACDPDDRKRVETRIEKDFSTANSHH